MEHHEEHHKKRRTLSKSFYTKIYIVLALALVIFASYNIYQSSSINTIFQQKLAEAEEAARPAKLLSVTLHDPNCNDCFDISPIMDTVKKANVNLTKELELEFSTEKGKELIEKYDIEKVPTILLLGEIDKTSLSGFEKRDDALVFSQQKPPYTNAKSSQIMGKVSAIVLKDSSCNSCTDLTPILSQIKQSEVKIVSEKVIERTSKEAQELINKYAIKQLPALIFSKDLEIYSDVTSNWAQVGSVEKDGSYVTRLSTPPYFDLTRNKVVGLVSMTVLVDESCENCYEPNEFHKPILQSIGVVFSEEKRVDISSSDGESLVSRYKIEKVPTILLSGDVEEYAALVNAWANVGTKEPDDVYVFRNVEVAQQTYKDLGTNKIVKP